MKKNLVNFKKYYHSLPNSLLESVPPLFLGSNLGTFLLTFYTNFEICRPLSRTCCIQSRFCWEGFDPEYWFLQQYLFVQKASVHFQNLFRKYLAYNLHYVLPNKSCKFPYGLFGHFPRVLWFSNVVPIHFCRFLL